MALIRLMEEVIPSTWLIFSISSPLRFPAPRGVPGLVLRLICMEKLLVMDRKAFDQMKESSQTLEGLVRIMMIVLLVTGAGALSLLLSLWTRERIHEIGVLLSIGKSKGRIFRQFLLEVVLVSLLAVIPAFLIGRMVSHRFLEQFVGQTGQQQTLDLLNQVPQGLSLGIAYASLLCLILLSLGVTTSMIWRKSPKEILTKMS